MGEQLPVGGSELEARVAEAVPVEVTAMASGREEDPVLRAGRRRLRWWIGGAVALALALASFAIVIRASVYEARASVLIRPPRGESGMPQAVGGALQSEVEILRSFDVLRQTLESIGIAVVYPGLEGDSIGAVRAAAVTRMRAALGVRSLPGSDVLEVTFRHPDADLAAEAVNRLVERYGWARGRMLSPVASRFFLYDQIGAQREALATAETALAAFRTEHPELVSGDAGRALAKRRSTLEAELRSKRDAADGTRSQAPDDPSLARAHKRLDELELELQKTLNTHVEGSRAVTGLEGEIARVRTYLAEKEQSALRARGRRLEQLLSRQRKLEAQLAALDEAETALPELLRQERELSRERDLAARRLDAYQHEFEAATLAADVGEHEVNAALRVLEPARPPTSTTIPEEEARLAWALVGVALLIVLGIFVGEVLEERRTAAPPPLIWAARVGGEVDAGSLSVLMPSAGHDRDAGPVELLRSGAGARGTGPDANG